MALTDIRSIVVEISGRADLDVSPYTSLDRYINRGQKLLDKLVMAGRMQARRFVEISVNQIFTYFNYCRAVQEVWLYTADGRYPMEKVSFHDLRYAYYENKDNIVSGKPFYYAPARLRAIGTDATKPETIASPAAVFSQDWALDDTVYTANWYSYMGIVWMPPSDAAYTMEIVGLFHSIPLDGTNNTKSFWTEEHEMLLAWAACYYIEASYRNTEGAKDWMNAILLDIGEIDKDTIEEEIADIAMQMEG